MGSPQRKKSRSVIYRAIQLPQLGREEGAWLTDLVVGSSALLARITQQSWTPSLEGADALIIENIPGKDLQGFKA